MKKLTLLLSLLALGTLGLVACGGGDETTAASETETTVSVSKGSLVVGPDLASRRELAMHDRGG